MNRKCPSCGVPAILPSGRCDACGCQPMTMKRKLITTAIVLYVLMAIFTFGHSYNRMPDIGVDFKSIGATAAAIAWPLYWSAHSQKLS